MHECTLANGRLFFGQNSFLHNSTSRSRHRLVQDREEASRVSREYLPPSQELGAVLFEEKPIET